MIHFAIKLRLQNHQIKIAFFRQFLQGFGFFAMYEIFLQTRPRGKCQSCGKKPGRPIFSFTYFLSNKKKIFSNIFQTNKYNDNNNVKE